MRTLLIVLTLVEVAVLVLVLATYLILIAARLRKVSHTLGLVTFGVRAIERQTEPIGPIVTDINAALEQVAGALEEVVGPTETAGGEPSEANVDEQPSLARQPTGDPPPEQE